MKFQQEHQAAIQRFGLSAMARFAMINPLPFTFSEARQRLQPRGGDHWIFDLLQDYGIRDGLYCAHGPWMMVYWSERALNGIRAAGLSREVRMTLDASSGAAIYRIRELTGRKKLLAIQNSLQESWPCCNIWRKVSTCRPLPDNSALPCRRRGLTCGALRRTSTPRLPWKPLLLPSAAG